MKDQNSKSHIVTDFPKQAGDNDSVVVTKQDLIMICKATEKLLRKIESLTEDNLQLMRQIEEQGKVQK